MRQKTPSITELPESPDKELNSRMVKYFITMAIRVICVVLCLFVRGWWLVLPVLGAVVLPYIAVVIANATQARPGQAVERPGGLVRMTRFEGEE